MATIVCFTYIPLACKQYQKEPVKSIVIDVSRVDYKKKSSKTKQKKFWKTLDWMAWKIFKMV